MNLAAPAWRKTKSVQFHNRTHSSLDWQHRNVSGDIWESLYGHLPPREKRIKEGWVDARVSAEAYGRFWLILTPNALYFAGAGAPGVANVIKFEHLERNVLQSLASISSFDGDRQNKTASGLGGSSKDSFAYKKSARGDRSPIRLQSLGVTSPIRTASEEDVTFYVETTLKGHTETITYYFRTEELEEGVEWVEALKKQVALFTRPKKRDNPTWQLVQNTTDRFYHNFYTQLFFGLMIMANFVLNAIYSEIRPEENSDTERHFWIAECTFTGIFTVEIALHLVACGDRLDEFFENRWNLFDMLVVAVSILGAAIDLVPGLGILRIIRAFRLLRLFGRLATLRRITNALLGSWLPVLNAMTVVLFTTGVYGILATQFFANNSPKHFGTFSKSLVTMFTVMTFDGWVDMMWNDLSAESINPGVIVFFVTFIVIVVWTMLSVVVAIMLDNFASASEKKETVDRIHIALDPLLQELSIFISTDDLDRRINLLYECLDFENLGAIGRLELCDGLRKLHKCPVNLALDDYCRITRWGELCNEQGLIGAKELRQILHVQLLDMIQEKASQEIARTHDERGLDSQGVLLCSIKMLHLNVQHEEHVSEAKKQVSDIAAVVNQINNRQQRLEIMMEELLTAQKVRASTPSQSMDSQVADDAVESRTAPGPNESRIQSLDRGDRDSNGVPLLSTSELHSLSKSQNVEAGAERDNATKVEGECKQNDLKADVSQQATGDGQSTDAKGDGVNGPELGALQPVGGKNLREELVAAAGFQDIHGLPVMAKNLAPQPSTRQERVSVSDLLDGWNGRTNMPGVNGKGDLISHGLTASNKRVSFPLSLPESSNIQMDNDNAQRLTGVQFSSRSHGPNTTNTQSEGFWRTIVQGGRRAEPRTASEQTSASESPGLKHGISDYFPQFSPQRPFFT